MVGVGCLVAKKEIHTYLGILDETAQQLVERRLMVIVQMQKRLQEVDDCCVVLNAKLR